MCVLRSKFFCRGSLYAVTRVLGWDLKEVPVSSALPCLTVSVVVLHSCPSFHIYNNNTVIIMHISKIAMDSNDI